MDQYIKAIAEGESFDVAEAIRAIAKQLVAKGLVSVEVEKKGKANDSRGKAD